MQVSVSLRTAYAAGATDSGQWVVDRARAARDAGVDALFVGDHHATGPSEAYFQNVAMLGRLLAEWDDRPFGGLFLLPLWHPVMLAEQIGTLAALGRGPFILQTAIGRGAEQFAAMGVPSVGRTVRFEVGLDLVRRLLAGETVSDRSGLFDIQRAAVAPVPHEPVEVWIGATATPAIERAARLGDGWICNAHVTPDEARAQAATYREQCEALGRTPGAVAIRRDVHVGATSADAAAEHERAVAAGYRGFRPEALTSGDATAVAQRLLEYGEMGYTDVVLRHFCDDQRAVLASIERLAAVRAQLG